MNPTPTGYSGVIFDLDGVIVSTDEHHYQAWKRMADDQGLPFDRHVNERLRGVSRMESLEIILSASSKAFSPREKASLAETKNRHYREALGALSPADILPGVKGLLADLRAAGIPAAIGSSSKNTPFILEKIGLAGWFEAVADGNDIRNSKPDPEVFLLAARRLGLAPEACIVIEDAVSGIEAARAAGMKAVAVGPGRQHPGAHLKLESLVGVTAETLFENHPPVRSNPMFDPRKAPFHLDDAAVKWVGETLASLTDDEKLGQLFCLIAYNDDEALLTKIARDFQAGGLMCRPMPGEGILKTVKILQDNAKVPMLIAANLEKGGTGIATDGTYLGCPMQVAATDDVGTATRLGKVCGREGAAVGANWAFAPVIDLDYNFRNPITNTRTFGSDPERVAKMGVAYVKAVQAEGVAASIKHFPGDGVDERDQHLVTSVNTMTCDEWDQTFGRVYRAAIDAGAMTVMVGHISHPAYSKALVPGIQDQEILPASLSSELLNGLLRRKLGFNGLVVTDATTMAGMVIPMPRSQAVPLAIAAGCDMFLFTRNMDEDYGFMKTGLEAGLLTRARLDEAVTKILCLKAALGLPVKKAAGTLVPSAETARGVLGCAEHRSWARDCADQAVTLVKEQKGLLPLSPGKYPKVLFFGIESAQGVAYSVRAGVVAQMKERFEKEGFQVDEFDASKAMEGRMVPFSAITNTYQLIVYVANVATKSNQTTVRIEWAQPMGANVPIHMETVPTVFISVENPYHLLDVPRVKTFINAYSSTDLVQEAIMDKLMGRSKFRGVSPVDPFCGKWDTRL